MSVAYIGVDPGVSGGWAVLDESGRVVLTMGMGDGPAVIAQQPETCRQRVSLAVGTGCEMRAVVERVHSSPQMGVVSAFTFGKNVGAILGALAAHRIPVDEVSPKAWQKVLGVVYPKGVPRDKNITKHRAQQVFPSITVTHAIADALLLAEYARRIDRANLGLPR